MNCGKWGDMRYEARTMRKFPYAPIGRISGRHARARPGVLGSRGFGRLTKNQSRNLWRLPRMKIRVAATTGDPPRGFVQNAQNKKGTPRLVGVPSPLRVEWYRSCEL